MILNTSKVSGLDKIPVLLLKKCDSNFAPVLIKLFIPCCVSGSLPDSWKNARVDIFVYEMWNACCLVFFLCLNLYSVELCFVLKLATVMAIKPKVLYEEMRSSIIYKTATTTLKSPYNGFLEINVHCNRNMLISRA